ncbi:MAG: ATPase domain-containing protein [Halobacteria archaeon]
MAAAPTTKLSTGIPLLDQILDGGIPPGSVVLLMANPLSMAEVFLYQFATTRKCTYISTIRKPEFVQSNMKDLNFKADGVTFVDAYSMFNMREEGSGVAMPSARKNIYAISEHNAGRAARIFVKQANIPKDMFWKFEFWSKEKALAVLGEIMDKIFSEMMKVSEGSKFSMADADPKNAIFKVRFANCDECAGLGGLKSNVCLYHAGIFAGLLTTLLGQEFDCYESACRASGAAVCEFVLGSRANADHKASLQKFLNPPAESPAVGATAFLQQTLEKVEKRSIVVVDTLSFLLEVSDSRDRVRRLLNTLYEAAHKTESIVILHLQKETQSREMERVVAGVADVVIDLETRESGQEIETSLAIAKVRGVAAPARKVKIHVKDRVSVDTAKEIA